MGIKICAVCDRPIEDEELAYEGFKPVHRRCLFDDVDYEREVIPVQIGDHEDETTDEEESDIEESEVEPDDPEPKPTGLMEYEDDPGDDSGEESEGESAESDDTELVEDDPGDDQEEESEDESTKSDETEPEEDVLTDDTDDNEDENKQEEDQEETSTDESETDNDDSIKDAVAEEVSETVKTGFLFRKKAIKDKVANDPDSFTERWRRARLLRQGWVILKTLDRDPKTGYFLLDVELIKKEDLPIKAVQCTGEKNTYCLDKIKDSLWYAQTRQVIYDRTRNKKNLLFTARDATLYMMSDKLDNALIENRSDFNTANIKKFLPFVAIGVGILIIVLMMRM